MVSESKVGVISFIHFSNAFHKGRPIDKAAWFEGLCAYSCMRAHIYTLTVRRWENKRRPSAFKDTFKGRWHRSPEALISTTPLGSECESFNVPKWMAVSIFLLNRALRARHLGREVGTGIHISVFLLRSRLFFIHILYYKNLQLALRSA